PLQVHAAAAAVAEPTIQTADLTQRAEQDVTNVLRNRSPRVDTAGMEVCQDLRQELVVPAVRTVHRVSSGGGVAGSDGPTFLPDAGVSRPVDETLGGELEHELLECADQHELAVHPSKQSRVSRVPVLPGDYQLGPLGVGVEMVLHSHGVLPC